MHATVVTVVLFLGYSSLTQATEQSSNSSFDIEISNRFNETFINFKKQLEEAKDSYKDKKPEFFNRTLSALNRTLTSFTDFVKSKVQNLADVADESSNGNSKSNDWNPGGQGEGFGEPARSKTGGAFRYVAGRGRDDSKDWQSEQKSAAQESPEGGPQSSFDWQKYAGESFDWHKYAGSGDGEDTGSETTESQSPPVARTEQRLEFNVTVTGRDVEVVSSFGVGGGRGGGEEEGQGGGGGGQHRLRLKQGRVEIMGGFDGETVTKKQVVLA